MLALLLALIAIPTWSLARVLTASNSDPLGARAVEWARDHQLGGVVGSVERIWYSHHQPPKGGTPKQGIPKAPAQATPTTTRAAGVPVESTAPPNVQPLVATPLPGEGIWQPSGRNVGGRPALWITYLRPDPVHTSLLAGLARLDMTRLRATLHAGTQLPGGSGWLHGAEVAAADYPTAIAAFNSGFRLDNSGGGYYAEGRTVRPLIPGRASLVTYADGHVDIGVWGGDATMTSSVTAVRQNLSLIVDNGAVTPGVATESSAQWGGTVGNRIYVWRSGVGVDAHGNLVYAAGPGLDVATLAELLRRAGCVRAMELDINTSWVSFTVFAPGPAPGGLHGTNLLSTMVRPGDRYLSAGTRDFVEVDARR